MAIENLPEVSPYQTDPHPATTQAQQAPTGTAQPVQYHDGLQVVDPSTTPWSPQGPNPHGNHPQQRESLGFQHPPPQQWQYAQSPGPQSHMLAHEISSPHLGMVSPVMAHSHTYPIPVQHQAQMPQVPIQQVQMHHPQPQMEKVGAHAVVTEHMQPMQHTTTFHALTPLAGLSQHPGPVRCPSCNETALTKVTYVSGSKTHLWAICLMLFICLPCIPYFMDSLKDARHKCGRCGVMLATWKNGGDTEVHMTPVAVKS